MALGFSRTRVSPIAIDFGSEQLKLLQVVPGNPPQLVAAAARTVPAEARADATARRQFLGEALPQALKSAPFRGKRAICSLPAYQTLVQNLELGRPDHGTDLSEMVADQLRQRLNVNPQRMVIRHHDLGQVQRNGSTIQQVLCLAASRDAVMDYLDLCARCKLDLVGMHSEPIAILRAFEDQPAPSQGGATCFIDIGAATTKLVIARNGQLVFAKTVHAAGDHLASQTAAQWQANAQAGAQSGLAAEAGAASSEPNAAATTSISEHSEAGDEESSGLAMLNAAMDGEGATAGEAASHASDTNGANHANNDNCADAGHDTDTIECLIDELQMSLRYHQRLHANAPVEKLVFIGGQARQMQTCQRIAKAVRVAAQLGDPIARLSRLSARKPPSGVDLNESQPGWAVPFGLCHSEANM